MPVTSQDRVINDGRPDTASLPRASPGAGNDNISQPVCWQDVKAAGVFCHFGSLLDDLFFVQSGAASFKKRFMFFFYRFAPLFQDCNGRFQRPFANSPVVKHGDCNFEEKRALPGNRTRGFRIRRAWLCHCTRRRPW